MLYLHLLRIIKHLLHVRIHMSCLLKMMLLINSTAIQPAKIVCRGLGWMIHEGKGIKTRWISCRWSGRLLISVHIVTINIKVLETIRSSIKFWMINLLRIAMNHPLIIQRITLITFIYIVKSPKPLIFDNRIAFGSLYWCLKMTKVRKTHSCVSAILPITFLISIHIVFLRTPWKMMITSTNSILLSLLVGEDITELLLSFH